MAQTRRSMSGMSGSQPMSQPMRADHGAQGEQALYDYQTQQHAPAVQFPYSTANFPQRVGTPSKSHFYPKGTRVTYEQGRHTFARTADCVVPPPGQPQINFHRPTPSSIES